MSFDVGLPFKMFVIVCIAAHVRSHFKLTYPFPLQFALVSPNQLTCSDGTLLVPFLIV